MPGEAQIPPRSIAGAAFLADPALQRLFDVVETPGTRLRAVGGAVRNTLIGVAVADVDLATDAAPETVMQRARAAGLAVHPTGLDHGTVTVVVAGCAFEVTTLRADIATDGRRATVAFTDDWAADAGRRDFTMNAIYADRDGTLFDPCGGIADALAGRVRFIGDPAARIAEDYLRILRFFRFHAVYGSGEPDAEGLAASIRARRGLDILSRERIGQEMLKLVTGRRAGAIAAVMQEAGLLGPVIAGVGRPRCSAACWSSHGRRAARSVRRRRLRRFAPSPRRMPRGLPAACGCRGRRRRRSPQRPVLPVGSVPAPCRKSCARRSTGTAARGFSPGSIWRRR
ncbi:CCA tRNA nucleotidyltransferase [Methylobrevis pamukkalensis]|uniref:CCA-adding enzyme n=1 Tax=Methylobrevis pamukkalensis TaxID=1439726 RepID=A0A1E3H5L6_9HYPH|nr:CCA tRNA nucleotidyltransferase [Methylobrevis pamukkalensis]ODN71594.1 CCA-adding enzyme [Methylobrevis pamukkalensis]